MLFDDYAKEYDSWFIENDKIYQSELNAVESLLDKDKNYIEIGVGTGLFASKLNIKEGIEPAKKMGEVAEKRGVKVINAFAENLPYLDKSVEGLLMVTVDCFIKDISKVFNEVKRVLKDDGNFVMAFLDRETPLGVGYEKNKADSVFYKDSIFRSSAEMKEEFKKAGLKVVSTKQTVYSFNNEVQPVKEGNGEGVFALIKVIKEK